MTIILNSVVCNAELSFIYLVYNVFYNVSLLYHKALAFITSLPNPWAGPTLASLQTLTVDVVLHCYAFA